MNRHVIITGASGDIGASIARRFAKEGDTLLLVGGKNREALEKLENELSLMGVRVCAVSADLSRAEECRRVMAVSDAFFGKPDLLINNAGISHTELFQDSSDDNYLAILNTNLNAAVRLSKEAVKRMLPEKSGRILNVSSVWGEVGASMEVEYSVTKGGINAFTRALAKELAPSGITVNAISPGAIDTKMNACYSEEELRSLAEEIPMGRMGTPEEVAELAYLLSVAPVYLTGQVIRIDGGWI